MAGAAVGQVSRREAAISNLRAIRKPPAAGLASVPRDDEGTVTVSKHSARAALLLARLGTATGWAGRRCGSRGTSGDLRHVAACLRACIQVVGGGPHLQNELVDHSVGPCPQAPCCPRCTTTTPQPPRTRRQRRDVAVDDVSHGPAGEPESGHVGPEEHHDVPPHAVGQGVHGGRRWGAIAWLQERGGSGLHCKDAGELEGIDLKTPALGEVNGKGGGCALGHSQGS